MNWVKYFSAYHASIDKFASVSTPCPHLTTYRQPVGAQADLCSNKRPSISVRIGYRVATGAADRPSVTTYRIGILILASSMQLYYVTICRGHT